MTLRGIGSAPVSFGVYGDARPRGISPLTLLDAGRRDWLPRRHGRADRRRRATTAAGTLATGFEQGDTVDGVVLAAGDRVLIKDQAGSAENGIYVVDVSGVPVRASDADTGSELRQAAMFVMEGTANADTAWVCTTDGTITLGVTALAFAQFGASTTYVEGTGIDIAGNVIAFETPVAVPSGGTGAASLTDHGVLLGSGTGAVTPTAVGTTGTVDGRRKVVLNEHVCSL